MTRHSFFLFSLVFLSFFVGCKDSHSGNTYTKISGETMGTFYNITCDGCPSKWEVEIEDILAKFNNELSTYIPDSYISKWNESENGKLQEKTPEVFIQCFKKSKDIFQRSGSFFDPTILPLLDYYGFGPSKREPKAYIKKDVDEILNQVGFDKLSLQNNYVVKDHPDIHLDFNAIAKGQGVDLIASYLNSLGVENYLVEIGGEVVAKGLNQKGKVWSLGINTPEKDAALNDLIEVVALKNKGMATSGNYRNHQIKNGQMLTHIINPITGMSEVSDVLSATVVAPDCMTADALATACMLLTVEESFAMINTIEEVELLLITGSKNGQFEIHRTDGFNNF